MLFKLGDKVHVNAHNIEIVTVIGVEYFFTPLYPEASYTSYLLGCQHSISGKTPTINADPGFLAYYHPLLEGWNKFNYMYTSTNLHLTLASTVNGYNCIKCNTYYPYAQANLPNNQLKCYSCRNP